jgi:hypothetical protein
MRSGVAWQGGFSRLAQCGGEGQPGALNLRWRRRPSAESPEFAGFPWFSVARELRVRVEGRLVFDGSPSKLAVNSVALFMGF